MRQPNVGQPRCSRRCDDDDVGVSMCALDGGLCMLEKRKPLFFGRRQCALNLTLKKFLSEVDVFVQCCSSSRCTDRRPPMVRLRVVGRQGPWFFFLNAICVCGALHSFGAV